MSRPDPDRTADTEAEPRCSYCGRRFVDGRVLALHRGREHPDRLSAGERTAYDAAYEAETAELRRFRLKALAVLVFVYFGFLFAYSIFG